MKTVMLVDDERPARELVKMLIDWEKAGYEIIWEARNGKQALEQYAIKRPDLIITDVQMPVMDGLELLQKIREISSSQKVVILSCYENFSYAKKALKCGVMDYLIKDALTDETMYSLLRQISMEEKASFSGNENSTVSPQILPALLQDSETVKKEAACRIQEVLKKGMDYFCCACRLEYFTGLSIELEMLIDELQQNLNEKTGGDVCLMKKQTLMVLCFVKHQSSKMDAFNTRFQSLRMIRQILEELTGCSVSIGVSSQSSRAEALEQLSSEAFQALESKLFQGTGKTLYYNPQYNRSPNFQIKTLNDQIQNIRNALEDMDENTLQKELAQVYNKGFSGIIHYNYLNYVNALLIDTLMEACGKRNISYEEVFETENLKLDVFDKMNTANEVYEWFKNCFSRLFRASDRDNAAYSPRIRKIIQYIHENYQQDISLETIADTFWIHKVYLAKIFKLETSKSVNEYIRSLRIEKAKELLMNDNIRINEIVTATGFNNPQSFYTLFKKYVGMKPGEYRDYCMGNNNITVP